MSGNPFLAIVERALADAEFLRALQLFPADTLAGAGLHLTPADFAAISGAAADPGGQPERLLQALVTLARQQGA